MKSGSNRFLFALPIWLTAALLVAGGCSDRSSPVAPASQASGHLQGRVRLVGQLFDGGGNLQGTSTQDDASTVPVYLLNSSGTIVDSTDTDDGLYEFQHAAAGTYRVASRVVPGPFLETAPFTVNSSGAGSPDTLKVTFSGDMHTSPNPPEPYGFGFEFTAAAPGRYQVQLLTLDLTPVWTYSDSTIGGFNHIHWSGSDQQGAQVPSAQYWAVVRVDNRVAWNLVWWEHGTAPQSGANCGHIDAAGFVLSHPDSTTAAWGWQSGEQGSLSTTASGDLGPLHLAFLAPDSTRFNVADTCSVNHLEVAVADTSIATATVEPGTEWSIRIHGRRSGSTTLTLQAWHLTHIHFTTSPIPITVTP